MYKLWVINFSEGIDFMRGYKFDYYLFIASVGQGLAGSPVVQLFHSSPSSPGLDNSPIIGSYPSEHATEIYQ